MWQHWGELAAFIIGRRLQHGLQRLGRLRESPVGSTHSVVRGRPRIRLWHDVHVDVLRGLEWQPGDIIWILLLRPRLLLLLGSGIKRRVPLLPLRIFRIVFRNFASPGPDLYDLLQHLHLLERRNVRRRRARQRVHCALQSRDGLLRLWRSCSTATLSLATTAATPLAASPVADAATTTTAATTTATLSLATTAVSLAPTAVSLDTIAALPTALSTTFATATPGATALATAALATAALATTLATTVAAWRKSGHGDRQTVSLHRESSRNDRAILC